MKIDVPQPESLERLIDDVRRRTILQLIAEQGLLAALIALVGLIALLLAGTQVLAWYVPVLLLAVAFGWGMLRVRSRFPDRYQVAQTLDQRLSFKDAVSTALFFSAKHEGWRAPEALVRAQRQAAERLVTAADPQVAAPMRMPRQAWACLAMVAVAGSLLVVRYGSRGSLDLQQPMVRIPFDSFLGGAPEVAANKPFPKPKLPDGMETMSVPSDGTEEQKGERRKAEDSFEAQAIESDEPAGENAQMVKEGELSQEGGDQQGEAGEKGEGEPGGEQQSQKDNSGQGGSQKNAKSAPEGGQKNASEQQNSENSSLMDKMRDAMQNMLSRMKMNPQAGEMGKQNQGSQKGQQQQQSASAQKQAGKKGQPAPGQKGEGQAKSEEAGEQEGEGSSKNENAQGKMSDAGGEKQTAQEGKSGAGKQDGDKDLKDAQQAAAMGKISEILGKRAENLTGEIMVEVSSGRQQLKTQYQDRSAIHGNAAGDVNRDEVPAAYQQFVQQYFEEVRKAGAGAGTGSTKAKPATTTPNPPE
jgi:hypothetical protein